MLLIARKNAAKPAPTLFDAQAAAREPADPAISLRRWQIMERIMGINSTACEEYLAAFSDESLGRYLAHLESMGSPRGARWERPGDSPAIMVRETTF